jgi:hypothetical protein
MPSKPKSPHKKKKPAAPPSKNEDNLSPHSAEKAFHKLRPALDALARSAIRQPNFNLQEGALVSLSVHGLLDKPEVRSVVDILASTGKVDKDLVTGLADMARAAWFVRHKLDLAEAVHSDASLPVKLVGDAVETRRRMLKVLDYHLDEDPAAQRMLASIRAGHGHMDLASDLIALADMYTAHKATLSIDKKGYRAADVGHARKLADDILSTLGGPGTPESRRWRDYQARAFTLLERHHEEAIRLGRFLFWYDGGEDLFPSLFAAVRSRPAKKAAPAAEVGSPAETPETEP